MLEPEPLPLTCGAGEPVRLLALPELGSLAVLATPADERFIVDGITLAGRGRQWGYSVDPCGESPVEVLASRPGRSEWLGAAGPWMLASDEQTKRIRWIDPSGVGPSHEVFAEAVGCLLEVDEGLVAQDATGEVWLHPDPADPTLRPRHVVSGTVVDHEAFERRGDFTSCSKRSDRRPVPDGEGGLLVVLQDGRLVSVPLRGGEAQTLTQGPAGRFVALGNARQLLWQPQDDYCCDVKVVDRQTGVETELELNTHPGDVPRAGTWVTGHFIRTPAYTFFTDVTNVATWETLRIAEFWDISAQVSESTLLLEPTRTWEDAAGNPYGPSLLDTTTGVRTPVELPAIPWDAPSYPDGVVGLELPYEDAQYGTLLLLPLGGGPIEVLADDVHRDYRRTQTGTILTFEDVDVNGEGIETGTLVLITREGRRQEIDRDVVVSSVAIPLEGTERERAEVLYLGAGRDRDGAGLWRYVVP